MPFSAFGAGTARVTCVVRCMGEAAVGSFARSVVVQSERIPVMLLTSTLWFTGHDARWSNDLESLVVDCGDEVISQRRPCVRPCMLLP